MGGRTRGKYRNVMVGLSVGVAQLLCICCYTKRYYTYSKGRRTVYCTAKCKEHSAIRVHDEIPFSSAIFTKQNGLHHDWARNEARKWFKESCYKYSREREKVQDTAEQKT